MRDAAYEGRHGHSDEAISTSLHDTGMRRGEYAQVLLDMLDFDDSTLRIPGPHPEGLPQREYARRRDLSARFRGRSTYCSDAPLVSWYLQR